MKFISIVQIQRKHQTNAFKADWHNGHLHYYVVIPLYPEELENDLFHLILAIKLIGDKPFVKINAKIRSYHCTVYTDRMKGLRWVLVDFWLTNS